jgi:hypothetical protein
MSLCKTSDSVVDTDEVLVRTRPYRILLAVTGSVATIKLQEVIDALIRGESRTANNTYSVPQYREVRVIMTESSKHFFNVPFDMENSGAKKDGGIDSIRMTDQQRFIYRLDSASLNRQLRNRDPRGKDQETATNDKSKVLVGNPNPQATVALQHINSTTPPAEVFFYDDECEYNAWKCKGDSVLHIDLKDWADVLVVVAPKGAESGLPSNIVDRELELFVFNILYVKADGWDGGHHLTQLELVDGGGFSGAVESDHGDLGLLGSEEARDGRCEVTHVCGLKAKSANATKMRGKCLKCMIKRSLIKHSETEDLPMLRSRR